MEEYIYMRKSQKTQLIVLIMVILMFGSSFAFIILGNEPKQETISEFKYIYDEPIDDSVRSNYLRNGFTILQFHYNGSCCEETLIYLDQMPNDNSLKYQGITQIIVEKIIEDTEPYIVAESMYDLQQNNRTSFQDIFHTLCNVLVAPPTECGFMQLNWTGLEDNTTTNTTEINITNSTRSTITSNTTNISE
jgi:hypothetical protein